MIIRLSILFLFFSLLACSNPKSEASSVPKENTKSESHDMAHNHTHVHNRVDYHSHSKPEKAVTKHLSLDLKADFESKTLSGSVLHKIENNNAEEIIFDIKGLAIDKVVLNHKDEVEFKITENDNFIGQALTVSIVPSTKEVKIYYATKPDAAAVQWLDPIQTTDKKYPFLFTQGQAILTRTWIPCQDSPGIRITYDAKIEVPKELMAVMSAKNPKSKSEDGIYNFEMKQPIPSYLIALAIGDLEFKEIGPRTGVYAEPSMLEKAYYEFGDMEKMLISAEQLYGPYLWDQYDVIVLPASFPFGGMENPRLTFATPTILAGDRSLTALIAHELAHSWSGNLVTNATWDDFWLNEGFTVYFERRIMEALYGEDYTKMLTQLGYQDLMNEINDLGHSSKDTHLKLDLHGRDPDDGMTDIAYEKGALFLMQLEQLVGREKFDQFLKKYFTDHKFQTITTKEFIVYLKENLLQENGVEYDIDQWIFSADIPADHFKVESDRLKKVEAYLSDQMKAGSWDTGGTIKWTTHEWLHYIRELPKNLTVDQAKEIDRVFGFSKSGNSEILAAWLEASINNGYYKNVTPELETFLVNVGRRKFLKPLYSALINAGDMGLAKKIYSKARPTYHSVSTNTMDALLKE